MNYQFLLETILKHLDEGILVVDKEANVIAYNEPVSNIAGITHKKEVLGRNIFDIFPDLTPKTSTFYRVLHDKEPIIEYVQTYLNHKKQMVSIVSSTLPLIKDGEIIGAVEIFRDFTQVKVLSEKNLNLQEQLYKKNFEQQEYQGNGTTFNIDQTLGNSQAIRELKAKIMKVADSSSAVLLFGETGTGKELLAQALHNASITRRDKPFIAQNCAAIPATLLEGILFGTTQGSFTGAKNKPGLFELANGGTILLDEINSMNFELQSKLLRILQEGIVRRLGDTKVFPIDVRIVASTNEDPLKAVENKTLRQDLYYRLNVVFLYLPPLRERKEDIPILVPYFINEYNRKFKKKIRGVSKQALDKLTHYNWPGNIRELKYTIESIMNFLEDGQIDLPDLPSNITGYTGLNQEEKEQRANNLQNMSLEDALAGFEQGLIEQAIVEANGNCALAARMLKVPKQTLHNKIKKLGITWKIKT